MQNNKNYILIISVTFVALVSFIALAYSIFTVVDSKQNKKSCIYNNTSYKSNETFKSLDGCNTCSCLNGEIACTLMSCATTPIPTATPVSTQPTVTPTPSPSPTPTPVESTKTYEDAYIKFQYPSTVNVTVMDGKVQRQAGQFDGVYRIAFKDSNSRPLVTVSYLSGAAGGFGQYQRDLSNIDKLYTTYPVEMYYITKDTKLQTFSSNTANGVVEYGVASGTITEQFSTDPNFPSQVGKFNFLFGLVKNNKFTSQSLVTKEDLPNILGGGVDYTDGYMNNRSPILISFGPEVFVDANSYTYNQTDVDLMFNIVKTLFTTVERKK
jgi:hypothetical protein